MTGCPRWAANLGKDADLVAAIAQQLHVGDRAGHCGPEWGSSAHFLNNLSKARRIVPDFFGAAYPSFEYAMRADGSMPNAT